MMDPIQPKVVHIAPTFQDQQRQRLNNYVKASDAQIISALQDAGETNDGLAIDKLENAGMNYARERVYVEAAFSKLPKDHILHTLSMDARLTLMSRGDAFFPVLKDAAEKLLLDGRPASQITAQWALFTEKRTKELMQQARLERQEPSLRKTTVQIISEQEKEIKALKNELAAMQSELTEAEQTINELIQR